MKKKSLFFNPFRLLSPKLDHEVARLDDLHQKVVSESVSLEEALLITLSKIIEMTRLVSKSMFSGSTIQMDQCAALAKEVHEQERRLTGNLVSAGLKAEVLRGFIRFPFHLERIGDLLESILNCCRIKAREGIPFSDKADAELDQLFTVLLDMMINLRDAFRTPNMVLLEAIISEAKKLSDLLDHSRLAHWDRVERGFCAVQVSTLYLDTLDSVKSINEYLQMMTRTLIDLGARFAHLSESQ